MCNYRIYEKFNDSYAKCLKPKTLKGLDKIIILLYIQITDDSFNNYMGDLKTTFENIIDYW